MPSRPSKLKWILIPAVTLGLLLGAAIALPFLVDLEKFKPQIQAAVGSAVNADLDFKSIRLHAIPKLGITIKNAEIRNADPTFKGVPLFRTDELFLATEFWPLLKGKMEGELRIVNPAIELHLNAGTNNLASLAKAPSDAVATPKPDENQAATPEAPAAPLSGATISALRDRVLIKSITITGAAASVKSNGKPLAKVSDLDFSIRNIGLDRDIDIALSTDLKAKEAGAVVGGAIKMNLTAKIESSADALFKRLAFNGNLDLKDLALNFQNALVKKPGQNIAMRIRGAASPSNLDVDELGFDILNIAGTGKLAVSDFKSLKTAFNMNIESPDVSSLGAMLPQHAKLLQKASLKVQAKVEGPLADLSALKADLGVESKLSGSDFNLAVTATSVLPAKAGIKFSSQHIDLGALLKPFLPPTLPGEGAAARSTTPDNKATESAAPTSSAGVAGNEKDFALSQELKDTIKPHVIDVDVAMNEIVWDRLAIKNLVVKAGLKDLEIALQQFSLSALGGSVRADGKLNLASAPVEFRGSFKMDGVSASDAIDVIAPAQKEALSGKLSLAMAVSARGTTRQTLSKTLSGKGSYSVSDVKMRGAALRPLVAESFSGFVSGLTSGKTAEKAFKNIAKFLDSPIGKRIPEDKKPKIDDLKKKIESIKVVRIPDKYAGEKKVATSSGQFEVNDGKIKITSDTSSDLGQFKLNAITTLEGNLDGDMEITLAETDKSALIKQSEYAALLLDKNKAMRLPFKLGGSVMSPKVTMQTELLTSNFEDNAAVRLEQEAKKALEDAARQAIKGALPALGIDKAKADEISKKTEDSRKKFESQAKDKLKGLFQKK
jgi:hypothetical protein